MLHNVDSLAHGNNLAIYVLCCYANEPLPLNSKINYIFPLSSLSGLLRVL